MPGAETVLSWALRAPWAFRSQGGPPGPTAREGGQPMRVAAVVVTYNRRDLLLESLAAVLAQTRAPDSVIVVDNASEDGTAAAVREGFPGVQVAELARNSGGAGGFAAGLALALAGRADRQPGAVDRRP